MKNKLKTFLYASVYFFSTALFANTKITLSEYAYDFTSIGYNISVTGKTSYFSPMSAGDYFRIKDNGYTIETRIEKMSRKGRKEFVEFYNDNCKSTFSSRSDCVVSVEGEVEMDEEMKMILTIKSASFIKPIVKRFQ